VKPIRSGPLVLHLGRFADSRAGGICRHVSQLLPSLTPYVRVANLVAAQDRSTRISHRYGYPVIEVASHGVFAATAMAPRMLPIAHHLLKRYPVGLVHLHLPDPLSLLIAHSLPRHVPIIATWHSDVVRQKLALKLYQPLMNALLRRMPAVIGATQSLFDTSIQLAAMPESRRHVIPYGLDVASIDNAPSRQAGRKLREQMGPAPIILGAGRHAWYKGFDILINAIEKLPNVRLVLAGHGEQTGALRDQVTALGLSERVHFTGEITDSELAAWYQACDVFCMPSVALAETFGLVQLEAMACGKPGVVTRLGNGVNEVHADGINGFAVPVGDANALADALNKLIADPTLRASMGKASRERVNAHFSLERMRDLTLAVYHEVLAAR
jgi:glycosyltransferase involved in cell wall biosynthesis